MIVYRITKAKYAEKLDGKGAAQSDINRWNSKGTEIIYTAESEALARAELSGHINIMTVSDLVLVEIEIPANGIADPDKLPGLWNSTPPGSTSKAIGDRFVTESNNLVLKVPSRYDEKQSNFLINPNFPGFEKLVKVKAIKKIR